MQPWVDEGFATVLSNVTEMIETMPYREAIKRKGEFEYLMQGKAHLEKVQSLFSVIYTHGQDFLSLSTSSRSWFLVDDPTCLTGLLVICMRRFIC